MSVKTMMTVEEYLHTSFEDADCDYLDGEVVERNVGELPHSKAQGRLIVLLGRITVPQLLVLPEIRIQINQRRFRVADIAVWKADEEIGDRIPSMPPFLVVEIMSPEDRMVRMVTRIQDYLAAGVKWIWLIDPLDRRAIVYSQDDRAGTVADVLRTGDPAIELPLELLFASGS
jgi:Uma2 family endonuclease